MPKPSKDPILFNEVVQFNIKDLKRFGYLDSGTAKQGNLTWSFNGAKRAAIKVSANTIEKQPFVYLSYYHNSKHTSYTVDLVSVPSNLGKGLIWYFRCPQTNKLCRKLYLIGGYFLHRKAFKGCYYECQTTSKKTRSLFKLLEHFINDDSLLEELYSKNFKRYYKGKATKKYSRIASALKNKQNLSNTQIEKTISGML